jgi:hypothetical protein
MRRTAIILSLLAALTGTPLRQAEAADDLSRALAELCQPGQIEIPDGRVGDDSELGTLRPASHLTLSFERDSCSGTTPIWPLPVAFQFDPLSARRWHGRATWPRDPARFSRAWLQIFLF